MEQSNQVTGSRIIVSCEMLVLVRVLSVLQFLSRI